MNFNSATLSLNDTITINNFLPKIGIKEIKRKILNGLTSQSKHISSMFFYDAVGSKLFEEITRLPEYYPTRTEKKLLKKASLFISKFLKNIDIIEFGSGDCSKISILLEKVPLKDIGTICYIPFDVSHSAIDKSSRNLLNTFPDLKIHGIVADFVTQIDQIPTNKKRLFCFLGSTLGNLSRKQAKEFLIHLGEVMRPGDNLLLGVDMVKDRDILEKAYNDNKNITDKFNRNILNVVNKFVETDFNPNLFKHKAFYNEEHSRIEMHLEAERDLEISCPELHRKILIKQGETIHTENSHKFTDEIINDLAYEAGLIRQTTFSDENKWYSLIEFKKN